MTTFTINDESFTVADNYTLQDLVDEFELNNSPVAIAVNREFIPRTSYSTTMVAEGNEIEIVTPMQGG